MPKTESHPTTTSSLPDLLPKADEAKADEVGAAEVQEKMDAATEQGFIGIKVDPLPNEAYSLEGGPPTAGNTSAK